MERLRRAFLTLATFAVIAACTAAAAFAATHRPNALDLRVDAFAPGILLTKPAIALADPARQIAAVRLVHWMVPGWFLMVGAQIVVFAYLWQSGTAARIRDGLRFRLRNEHAVRACFGAALALAARIAALLPELYMYRVQRVMGLSDELLRLWATTWLVNTAIAMALCAFVVVGILWLVDRTHQWYLYTIAAIVACSAVVTVAAPSVSAPFTTIAPLPLRAQAAVRGVLLAAHHEDVPVVEEIRAPRSRTGTAFVAGAGPTERIVVGDADVAAQTPGELRFTVAQQLGMIDLGAPWRLAIYDAAFVIVGIALAVTVSDRIGFRRDDDAVSRLALVAAFLGCVYLVVEPVQNAILRGYADRADSYAVALTHDRSSAVRAVIRTADQRMQEVCPEMLARLFFSPAVEPSARVRSFNGVAPDCPR